MSHCQHKERSEKVIPWDERVSMLSIHPDAATREDVARMAAEVETLRKELGTYHAQDNQEHRLIAKIEILEAQLEDEKEKAKNLRKLAGMQKQYIRLMSGQEGLISPRMFESKERELRTKIAELERGLG